MGDHDIFTHPGYFWTPGTLVGYLERVKGGSPAFTCDFAIENSHFWTPETLDMYLERVKMALSHALLCLGM